MLYAQPGYIRPQMAWFSFNHMTNYHAWVSVPFAPIAPSRTLGPSANTSNADTDMRQGQRRTRWVFTSLLRPAFRNRGRNE